MHGRQVTSLLCYIDLIMSRPISAYSGTSGSPFLTYDGVYNGEQEKETIIRVRTEDGIEKSVPWQAS